MDCIILGVIAPGRACTLLQNLISSFLGDLERGIGDCNHSGDVPKAYGGLDTENTLCVITRALRRLFAMRLQVYEASLYLYQIEHRNIIARCIELSVSLHGRSYKVTS
jgi:hypothetical protein